MSSGHVHATRPRNVCMRMPKREDSPPSAEHSSVQRSWATWFLEARKHL